MLKLILIVYYFMTFGVEKTDLAENVMIEVGAVYVLQSLDGTDFPARATITFDDAGTITGNGPCNTFNASLIAPYPWFEAGPITSTRMACPDLAAEDAYFAALAIMNRALVSGDTLELSNDAGRHMVFQAE